MIVHACTYAYTMHALRYELGNLISEKDFGFNWTHPGEPPARPRPLLPSA